MVSNYLVRQALFDHLPILDIANFIYATQMGQEIGKKELGTHLHPMKHLFADDELEIISKRILEGYAIVLWGRDLREFTGFIGKVLAGRECPDSLSP